MTTGPGVAPAAVRTSRVAWIDLLRVVGAVLIFARHFWLDYTKVVGFAPTDSTALLLIRSAPSYFGEWGVSMFVILAGVSFGLSYRDWATSRSKIGNRMLRLLVPLWVIAVPYVLAGVVLGEMSVAELWKVPIWLTGLGVVSPVTFLPVSAAWWYVSLALQCVVLLPLVVTLVRRVGLGPGVVLLALIQMVTLWLVGRLPIEWEYLTHGLVFSRLIEIGLGVVAAEVCLRRVGWVRASLLVLILVAGAQISRTVILPDRGMIADGVIVGVWAIVVIALSAVVGTRGRSPGWLVVAAGASYPFYLLHAPIGKYTITWLSAAGMTSYLGLTVIAASLSILAALVTTRIVKRLSPARSSGPSGVRERPAEG